MDSRGEKLNKVTESRGRNKELNFEFFLAGFDNLLRDKNRTYAELRLVELPVTDPVVSTFRNNISRYPIQGTEEDEDPEDVEILLKIRF
ncbi:hypothetical protein JTB14_028248 [Gonioctena quinquepunctata]|nr:hypothetical protein JTB14_028248 [Gonioctena quinquepunctata]